MNEFRKSPTEQEALDLLSKGQLQLPPLAIQMRFALAVTARDQEADAVVGVSWGGKSYDFAVEYKSRSSPKVFQFAMEHVQKAARRMLLHPMIVLPYLQEYQLRELEEAGVSGIDLCGNGIVIVPGELLVFRTGSPNQFRDTSAIKNIYRGTTSLVARTFLQRAEYRSVTEIREEILRKGKGLTQFIVRKGPPQMREPGLPSPLHVEIGLSTVSKALKVLTEELIVAREGGVIHLLQPEKLLERLVTHFRPPETARSFRGKARYDQRQLMQRLMEQAGQQEQTLAVTGMGSVARYSVMARPDVLSVYCTDMQGLLTGLDVEETNRFPNLEVLETRDEAAYFDLREKDGYPWSSPVQTYLELMCGDKRDQETAADVKAVILRELRGNTLEPPIRDRSA